MEPRLSPTRNATPSFDIRLFLTNRQEDRLLDIIWSYDYCGLIRDVQMVFDILLNFSKFIAIHHSLQPHDYTESVVRLMNFKVEMH